MNEIESYVNIGYNDNMYIFIHLINSDTFCKEKTYDIINVIKNTNIVNLEDEDKVVVYEFDKKTGDCEIIIIENSNNKINYEKKLKKKFEKIFNDSLDDINKGLTTINLELNKNKNNKCQKYSENLKFLIVIYLDNRGEFELNLITNEEVKKILTKEEINEINEEIINIENIIVKTGKKKYKNLYFQNNSCIIL